MLQSLREKLSSLLGHGRGEELHWPRSYVPVATEADIFYCFRLLLGRHPHREEWRGHAMRAGEDLARLVSDYLSSLEFSQRNLLSPAEDVLPDVVSAQGFRIYASRDDADVGRHVHADNYEHDVTAVFRSLLRPGMNVLDVGANIGYFSMLSAALIGPGGHVLAVEPNPHNARMLEASRRLNGFEQVTVAQVAAAERTGLLVLHAARSNGTATPPGDDMKALLAARTVPCLPLDRLLSRDRRLDLIKVDVEGAEYLALRGCGEAIARDRPTIISEFSPDLMPGISGISGEDYLRWLISSGYGIAVIQSDGSTGPAGHDPAPVMAEYWSRRSDHLDILATVA